MLKGPLKKKFYARTSIAPYYAAAAGGLAKGVYYNNGFTFNNTAQTTYTLTNVPIGTADANRLIVLALGIRSTAVISITGVTIDDGSGARSATETIGKNIASTVYSGLWQLPSTSGTTATVVVTVLNAAVRICLDSYSVITTTTTASATASSAANNPSLGLTNPASAAGAIITSSMFENAADNNATPTGYTEDIDTHVSTSTYDFTAGHDNLPSSGAKTYTVTWTGTPGSPAGVSATWAQ